MKLDLLKPVKGSTKPRKRRGRGHGSGLGKSAGRGNKGAAQRSGYKRRPWFEGGQMSLARRLPTRGFTSKFKKEFQIVNLVDISDIEHTIINSKILLEKGLIRSAFKPVKVLANGDINVKKDITATAFSKSAKEKIEKAGGSAIEK